MGDYGHERLIDVFKREQIDKKYSKIILFILCSTLVSCVYVFSLGDSEITFLEGDIYELIGILIALILGTPATLMMIKPTWFKIGETYYCKTVITNKWEYDDFKRSKSKKEDWKR